MFLPKLQTRVDPTHDTFERLTPIFDDVPTIHDLLGRGSAKLCPASILPGTISADPVHERRERAASLRKSLRSDQAAHR